MNFPLTIIVDEVYKKVLFPVLKIVNFGGVLGNAFSLKPNKKTIEFFLKCGTIIQMK